MTKEQCRAARALLGWTLDQLAERSEISKNSISRFESGVHVPRASTIKLLRLALEEAGIEFLSNGDGPGLRLRTPPDHE